MSEKTKARVLKWANKIRAKHFNKKPLKRLPKGKCASGIACVVHNCFTYSGDFRLYVDNSKISLVNPTEEPCVPFIIVPKYISKFIDDFDNGKYPELERK